MLLIAHRGLAAADRTENTADAVAAAVASGADGCEVDLRLAADGLLLACHDDDLLRVAGVPLLVSRETSAVLRAVPLVRGGRLARLPELVEAVQGRRLVLELKRPPSRLPGATALALAGELRSLRRGGRSLDVTVSSSWPPLLDAVRALGLPVRTALVGRPGAGPVATVLRAAALGCQEVHPHVRSVDAASVDVARTQGLAVVPWTVNGSGDARDLRAAGVEAVITDDPALLRATLTRVPAPA